MTRKARLLSVSYRASPWYVATTMVFAPTAQPYGVRKRRALSMIEQRDVCRMWLEPQCVKSTFASHFRSDRNRLSLQCLLVIFEFQKAGYSCWINQTCALGKVFQKSFSHSVVQALFADVFRSIVHTQSAALPNSIRLREGKHGI